MLDKKANAHFTDLKTKLLETGDFISFQAQKQLEADERKSAQIERLK